jgi:hypothetical protein
MCVKRFSTEWKFPLLLPAGYFRRYFQIAHEESAIESGMARRLQHQKYRQSFLLVGRAQRLFVALSIYDRPAV